MPAPLRCAISIVPPELADAFLDAAQPEPGLVPRDIEPDAVVHDRDVEASASAGHRDADAGGGRVPDAVGQRFLDDAVDAGAMLVGQLVEVAVDARAPPGGRSGA